jgi:tetratricopeptide (TPR) repeat protein
MTRHLIIRGTLLILLAAVGALGGFFWNAHSGLSDAQRLARHDLWEYVPPALDRYLRVFPHNGEARLLMAEALVRGEQPVEQAFEHLRRIPDSSPYAAVARTKEGQLELFILNRPSRAERLLRRAIELSPQEREAYYILWKLYDLTGRSQLVEPLFWKVYELSPPEEQVGRLGEWYMSQFYPRTANPRLDELLGIVEDPSNPEMDAEGQRLLRFRQLEPDGPVGYAALAQWLQQMGDPTGAVQLLELAEKNVPPQDQRHPFLLATRAAAAHDLGNYDALAQQLESWPQPPEGFEYWLWLGIFREEAQGDFRGALEAYEKAIEGWPGDADWRTRTRMANCATRLGETARAEELRQAAQRLQQLMEEDVHQQLRAALARTDDPEAFLEMAQFYDELDRPEAACWREQLERLRRRSPENSSTSRGYQQNMFFTSTP